MGWMDNMVLRSKLIMLTAIMVIGLMILGAVGLNSVSNWKKQVNDIGGVSVPSLLGLMDMRAGSVRVILQQFRARGLKDDPQRFAKTVDVIDQMNKAWELYNKGYAKYNSVPHTQEEMIEFKKFEDNFAKWQEIAKKIQNDAIEPLSRTNDPAMVDALYVKLTELILEGLAPSKALGVNIDAVIKMNADLSNASVEEAKKDSSLAVTSTITVSAAALLLAIILATIIIRSVNRSISQSVTSIRDGAMQITSASDQVASSSSSLAQGASQQASSVEQVSATLEQSTAINSQNTDNARQADILAKNANDSARAGYEKGEQLAHSMQAITASASKISGIIKAIDQIAFQTNLLALNAAVEAARAGEHGLGFAVVADEVRNLAQRAAAAAKETSDIIEVVVEQIKEGNQIAQATHTSFQEIVDQSKKVSDLIGEISIAGREQSEGMAQINQAMGHVDQVTQQVAANSEEAAAAAEELNAQATSMMDTVRTLAKLVGMQTDTPVAAPKKKTLAHIEMKSFSPPKKVMHASSNKVNSSSRSEDIFPLHEDDLKEF